MYFMTPEVLVNTLGSEPAWQELWSKLNTTLHQIKLVMQEYSPLPPKTLCRCLSEDMNRHHFQPAPKIKGISTF